MGKLLMGSNTQKTTSKSDPWGPQGDALKKAFSAAGSIYDSQANTPWFQGDLHAGLDPLTGQGIDSAAGYATGAGANTAAGIAGASSGLFGAAGSGLGAYGQLSQMAGQDPTALNIRNAGAYAANPYMDGMVDAASRDVRRNLSETVLPEIDRAATATGNINSSRAGIASGIAQRGAQDTIADISAGLRGGAYQSGLGLSEGARTANMSALGTAGSGYGGLFGMGINGAQSGMDMAYRNADALTQGGLLRQQDAQGQLDANFKAWDGQDKRSSDLLSRYLATVGSNNWGGTQSSTVKGPTPGLIQMGLAAASTAASFSDRRLKTNIARVGELEDGLGVYDFDYRDGLGLPEGPQRGVMADEVAELRPWALGAPVGGFATVHYERL